MIFKNIQGTEPILYVYDPERIEEQVLGDMLNQGTYPIKCVTKKKNILEYIKKEKIHIALISIHISFMDPYDLCYEISVHKKSLPILLIISSPDAVDIPKAIAMGVSDIICAPYIKTLIWVRIETYLRLKCFESYIESEYNQSQLNKSNKTNSQIQEKSEIRKRYKFKDTNILLAEDNEMSQQLMKNILRGAGINLEIVSNGQEAVDRIKSKYKELSPLFDVKKEQSPLFDAILMDIQMPVLNGYLAATNIQEFLKNNHQPEIPVIAITAHTQSNTREKCLLAGMLDYLAKPIDPENCLEMLSQWIHSDKVTKSEKNSESCKPEQASLDMLQIEGIDINKGIKRAAGNEKLYKDLLLDFYEEYRHTGKRLLELKKKGKHEDLKILVHTLKGLGGNIGAEQLQENALMLEKAIKSNVKNDIQYAFQILVKTLNDLMKAIKQQSPHLKTKETRIISDKSIITNDISDASLKLELKELYQLLDQGRTNSIDYLNKILTKVSKKRLSNLDELNKLISTYEYEKAQKVLNKIICEL
ncbi:Signal transduction response regulator, receiver region domain protein [Candidatus Magnetomorum sp. HK-1]|nr:Signal transduction response regulator, receiver region domain protein [Candidatus Magnetomorum sp. HK-1]